MKIAIIPARGGSKRIKDKNIISFCGKPIISYSLEAARDCGLFDIIHVSTDSERIASVVSNLGFPVEFLRDPGLSDDHAPLMPVLRWVLNRYEELGRKAEDVCLLMPCAPLIEASDLQAAYKAYESSQRQTMLLAVVPFAYPIERALVQDVDGTLKPLHPEDWHKRSQDLGTAYHDAGVFSFSPAKHILNPDLIVTDRFLPFVLPHYKASDIDEPADLDLAKVLYRGLMEMRASNEDNASCL